MATALVKFSVVPNKFFGHSLLSAYYLINNLILDLWSCNQPCFVCLRYPSNRPKLGLQLREHQLPISLWGQMTPLVTMIRLGPFCARISRIDLGGTNGRSVGQIAMSMEYKPTWSSYHVTYQT